MLTLFVIKLVSETFFGISFFNRYTYFCVSYIIVIIDRIGHTLFKYAKVDFSFIVLGEKTFKKINKSLDKLFVNVQTRYRQSLHWLRYHNK